GLAPSAQKSTRCSLPDLHRVYRRDVALRWCAAELGGGWGSRRYHVVCSTTDWWSAGGRPCRAAAIGLLPRPGQLSQQRCGSSTMPTSSQGSPLRVVVAGVGSFAQRVLIPGLIACPDAELVAIFGPTPAKTQRVAREKGVPRAYSDYEQMLDEVRPEAVVVATPNDLHYPMALAAIRRGMAVLCEKPLALTVAQAREMAQAAREMGVPTAVNFTYRSTNPMRHVERLLRQGRLGTLYHFCITFWQNIRADPSAPLAYRMLRERGGGALMDIGVHMVDLLRWWFGELEAVCGTTHIAIGERPAADGERGTVTADDTASFLVRLPGGVAG